jgi:zinc transport system substrate-binding protein
MVAIQRLAKEKAMSANDSPRRFRLISPLFVVAFIAAFLVISALWPRAKGGLADDGKLRIVCTFLPVYVFTQNVVGDAPDVEVQLLLDRDVGCPHSYSLTGRDLKMLSRADLLVANGLGAEPFLDQVTRGQRKLTVLTVSDHCDLITGDTKALLCDHVHDHADEHVDEADAGTAVKSVDEHAHDHATCTGHHHDHGSDVNAHTWVSPRQAAKQVRTLAFKLGTQDPQRAETYTANAEAYAKRLEALAAEMEQASQSFTNRNIVTGHDSFDYLARDLGLNVVATLRVIPGETGSATELARVINTVRTTKAAAVFWEPPFGDRVADTVARETGVPVYPLNPFNTDAGLPVPQNPEDTRRMYEDVMRQNLATLQKALAVPPP